MRCPQLQDGGDSHQHRLDLSPQSPHIKRRIWQETLSTLLLSSPGTAMAPSNNVAFVEGPEAHWPPYLSNFQGSAGERHVENVKVRARILCRVSDLRN